MIGKTEHIIVITMLMVALCLVIHYQYGLTPAERMKNNISATYHEEHFYMIQTNAFGCVRLAYPRTKKISYGADIMHYEYVDCDTIEQANELKVEAVEIAIKLWNQKKLEQWTTVK